MSIIVTNIKYNGNTIATIAGTGSKTLNCSDKYMSGNVEVVGTSYNYNPVGGRIFYINTSVSGATYTFYDSSLNVLSTQTVSGLENAVYYSKSGSNTNNADKFYVYDSTNGLATDLEWGARGTDVGITSDGIGLGKTNTATALTNSACFTPYTSGNTTIWTYLRDTINANSVGGCNDWFVGSEAEQNQLRSSGLIDWYSSELIWSSVEKNSTDSYVWNYIISDWNYYDKYYLLSIIPLRSF